MNWATKTMKELKKYCHDAGVDMDDIAKHGPLTKKETWVKACDEHYHRNGFSKGQILMGSKIRANLKRHRGYRLIVYDSAGDEMIKYNRRTKDIDEIAKVLRTIENTGADLKVEVRGESLLDELNEALAADLTVAEIPKDTRRHRVPVIGVVATTHPNLQSFAGLAQAAGLTQTLLEPDLNVIAFIPSDEAIEQLPEDAVEYLLSNRDALEEVLKNHLVAITPAVGKGFLASVGGDELATLAGETIVVNADDIVEADIVANNGIIHIVDTVFLPDSIGFDFTPAKSIRKNPMCYCMQKGCGTCYTESPSWIEADSRRNPMPEGYTFDQWAESEAGKHGNITFKDWAKEEAGEFYEELSEYEYSGALGEPANRDAAIDGFTMWAETEMDEDTHSRQNPMQVYVLRFGDPMRYGKAVELPFLTKNEAERYVDMHIRHWNKNHPWDEIDYSITQEPRQNPMQVYAPGKQDIENSKAAIRAEYPNVQFTDRMFYLVNQTGASNKYHAFFMTNLGGFNAYARIGYKPKVVGPMDMQRWNNKIGKKMNGGYEKMQVNSAVIVPEAEGYAGKAMAMKYAMERADYEEAFLDATSPYSISKNPSSNFKIYEFTPAKPPHEGGPDSPTLTVIDESTGRSHFITKTRGHIGEVNAAGQWIDEDKQVIDDDMAEEMWEDHETSQTLERAQRLLSVDEAEKVDLRFTDAYPVAGTTMTDKKCVFSAKPATHMVMTDNGHFFICEEEWNKRSPDWNQMRKKNPMSSSIKHGAMHAKDYIVEHEDSLRQAAARGMRKGANMIEPRRNSDGLTGSCVQCGGELDPDDDYSCYKCDYEEFESRRNGKMGNLAHEYIEAVANSEEEFEQMMSQLSSGALNLPPIHDMQKVVEKHMKSVDHSMHNMEHHVREYIPDVMRRNGKGCGCGGKNPCACRKNPQFELDAEFTLNDPRRPYWMFNSIDEQLEAGEEITQWEMKPKHRHNPRPQELAYAKWLETHPTDLHFDGYAEKMDKQCHFCSGDYAESYIYEGTHDWGEGEEEFQACGYCIEEDTNFEPDSRRNPGANVSKGTQITPAMHSTSLYATHSYPEPDIDDDTMTQTQFVSEAYRGIMQREPDKGGHSGYRRGLKSDEGKVHDRAAREMTLAYMHETPEAQKISKTRMKQASKFETDRKLDDIMFQRAKKIKSKGLIRKNAQHEVMQCDRCTRHTLNGGLMKYDIKHYPEMNADYCYDCIREMEKEEKERIEKEKADAIAAAAAAEALKLAFEENKVEVAFDGTRKNPRMPLDGMERNKMGLPEFARHAKKGAKYRRKLAEKHNCPIGIIEEIDRYYNQYGSDTDKKVALELYQEWC